MYKRAVPFISDKPQRRSRHAINLTKFVITSLLTLIIISIACSCNKSQSRPSRAKMVLEPRFNDPISSEGLTLTKVESTFGYFDKTGRCVIDLGAKGIDTAWAFTEGLAKVKKDGKYGFIGKLGTLVIPPQFNHAWMFSEGLAAVEKDGKWGFIDKIGAAVIPHRFSNVYSFSDGYARVNEGGSIHGCLSVGGEWIKCFTKGGKNGYIDRTGKMVIAAIQDWTFDFVGGMAKVNMGGQLNQRGTVEGGKWGFMDKAGILIAKPIYDEVYDFADGFAAVAVDKLWGFIDAKGNVLIEPRFKEAYHFSEGLACVLTEDGYQYIDTTGRFVITHGYRVAGDFVDGLAPASKDGRAFGFIDKKGGWFVKPEFYDVDHFSEGFAVVRQFSKDSLKRVQSGHPCKDGILYGNVSFEEGTVMHFDASGSLINPSKVTFINRKGEKIISQEFDDARSFKNGFAGVKINGKWGYLEVVK